MKTTINKAVSNTLSRRHVPAKIVECPEIPVGAGASANGRRLTKACAADCDGKEARSGSQKVG